MAYLVRVRVRVRVRARVRVRVRVRVRLPVDGVRSARAEGALKLGLCSEGIVGV